MRPMFDHHVLNKTVEWFETAIPEPNERNVQTILGVHFEEVAEMVATLKGTDRLTQSILTQTLVALHGLALHLKTSQPGSVQVTNQTELLDAVCDQIVTSAGVGYHYGHNVVGAVDEVNRSNFSKFVNGKPLFDQNMKIIKGPNYEKARLKWFTAEFTSENAAAE